MELEAVETRSDSVAVLSFEASGCKPRTQKHPSMTFLGGMMLHGQVSMISGQFLAKAISIIVPISACRPPRPISTSSIASAVRARTRDSTTARTTAKRLLGSATHAMHMSISRHYDYSTKNRYDYSYCSYRSWF